MTKKDYEKIAESLRLCCMMESHTVVDVIDLLTTDYLIPMFKKDNPNFNENTFKKAVGMTYERSNNEVPSL